MEIEHGKTWSYIALMIGIIGLVLYCYGNIYSFMAMLVGFLGIIFMIAMYMNLYDAYIVLLQKDIESEIIKKMELSKFGPIKTTKDSDRHGESKAE